MLRFIIIITIVLILLFVVSYFVFYNNKPRNQETQDYKIKAEEWDIPFSKAYNEMTKQEQITRNKCPKFSEKGYKVGKLPLSLKKRLLDVWNTKNHLKTQKRSLIM